MFRQMRLFLSERQAIPPTIKVPCLIIPEQADTGGGFTFPGAGGGFAGGLP